MVTELGFEAASSALPAQPEEAAPGISEAEGAPDWAAIQADYECGNGTLEQIAERHGVTHSALTWRIRSRLWARRKRGTAVARPQIIARLFRLLERQVIAMEKHMEDPGEKEVAVLGKLVSTLEKLIDIDKAASPPKPAAQHKDMQDLRNKLARRIAQLKRV